MRARDRMMLGVLAAAGVLAALWLGVLAPKRSDVKALDAKISKAEQRRDTAAAGAATAAQAKARYREDYATVARLGKAVPADDDVASLVFQLETIAKRHKVDFRSVALASGAAAAAPAPAPAPAEPGKEGAKPADAPAAPAAPAATEMPPGAVVGAAGLTTMPFTFVFEGSFLKLQRFLHSIDGLIDARGKSVSVRGRLLTVDGFTLNAARDGLPRIKAEVKATAYLVPESEGLTGAATPQGPAGATPQPAATGAPAAPPTTATVGGTG